MQSERHLENHKILFHYSPSLSPLKNAFGLNLYQIHPFSQNAQFRADGDEVANVSSISVSVYR